LLLSGASVENFDLIIELQLCNVEKHFALVFWYALNMARLAPKVKGLSHFETLHFARICPAHA
jgi:hypothetical protein